MLINSFRFANNPPFTNTYLLDFDGADAYLNLGNGVSFEYTDSFSYSFWLKPNAVNGAKNLYTKYDAGRGIYTYINSVSGGIPNNLYFSLFNTNSGSTSTRKRITTSTGAIIPPNVWTNIVITYDGSGLGSGINVYKNGVSQTVTVTQDNLQNQTIVNTADSYLSAFNGISSFFPGGQDEFAIFNTELSEDNALSIYNGGVPTDLTSLSPVAWYRMGDNGAYKSPQWLLPSNENKDKVSNYSFEFDGVDDYVDVGTSLNLGTDSTISFWVKRGRVNTDEMFLGENTYLFDYLIFVTSSNTIYIRINTVFLEFTGTSVTSVMNDTTNWINIVAVRSGDSIELFLNGNSVGTQSGYGALIDTRFDTIAAKPSGGFPFMGNIDELAAWDNNTINPLDIYNGGTPTTLPSGAVAHYKMGEEANFTTNWLVDNSALTNYSKRSFAFDGIDAKVELGAQSLGITGAISVSAWVKIPTTNTGGGGTNIQEIVCEDRTSGTNRNWALNWRGGGLNEITGLIWDSAGSAVAATTTAIVPNDGFWHHLMFTYTGDTSVDGLKLFVDGMQRAQGTSANGGTRATTAVVPTIGGLSQTITWMFEGNIDEVSIFNEVVDIADVWDGSGEPIDVSAVSGIVNNYRMGEDASFDGTNWTVPDNVGSNDGTSNAMTVDALVGEAPNYSGGGISNAMTIEDRVGEAPNSENNALSYNMESVDRTTDVPT